MLHENEANIGIKSTKDENIFITRAHTHKEL